MKGSIRQLVKGGLIYQYFKNPFLVWCNAHAPKEEKDPESAYISMILENGRNHEDDVCKEFYPGGVDIDPTLHGKAFMQSLEAMARGEPFVKNGIIYNLPRRYVAVPDVLVKKPGSSVFGDWYYDVVEIKSSKQIREEHVMQAAYYTHVMGLLQGTTPETFVMIDGQKTQTTLEYKDYKDKVGETVQEILDIYAGKKIPAARVDWPWKNYSLKMLRRQKAISLIPNLFPSHRDILEQSGIQTLEDFFSLNIMHVQGINGNTLERYRLSAKALMQGKHSFLDKPYLPEGRVELFLDFEGVEQVSVKGEKISGDYLIGVLVREQGNERYHSFVAESLEQEHDMVVQFLKFLQEKGEWVIYHFGSYEKSHLARLLHKYSIQEEFAERVLDAMVDILQVVKKSVVFPTASYTLKDIGSYLGMKWSDVADAKDSIVLYLDFLKTGEQETLDRIIQYNQEDCVALKQVKDFLVWGT